MFKSFVLLVDEPPSGVWQWLSSLSLLRIHTPLGGGPRRNSCRPGLCRKVGWLMLYIRSLLFYNMLGCIWYLLCTFHVMFHIIPLMVTDKVWQMDVLVRNWSAWILSPFPEISINYMYICSSNTTEVPAAEVICWTPLMSSSGNSMCCNSLCNKPCFWLLSKRLQQWRNSLILCDWFYILKGRRRRVKGWAWAQESGRNRKDVSCKEGK